MSAPTSATASSMVDSGLPQRSSRNRDERRQQRRNRQHHDTDDDNNNNHNNNTDNEPQPMAVSPTAASSAADWPTVAPCFEFLDHTADVQFHAWGDTLATAFTNLSLCMHTFMCDRPLPPPTHYTTVQRFTLTSHSLPSLLFHFLDESLYLFLTRDLLITAVPVHTLARTEHSWLVEGEWRGVRYEGDEYGRGTEVKAITYSNMQLYVEGKRVGEEAGTGGGEEMASAVTAAMHGADLYVIVDI